MTYRLTIKPSARKELECLPDDILQRVDAAVLSLSENPSPHGVVKLSGAPLYRIRIGAYRVVDSIDDQRREVDVARVGHRREIYRR